MTLISDNVHSGWYELRDPITYLQPEDQVDKTQGSGINGGEDSHKETVSA